LWGIIIIIRIIVLVVIRSLMYVRISASRILGGWFMNWMLDGILGGWFMNWLVLVWIGARWVVGRIRRWRLYVIVRITILRIIVFLSFRISFLSVTVGCTTFKELGKR
jgi:hypothetical protein